MTFLYIVIAYLFGMAASKLTEDLCAPEPMKLRHYLNAILLGWLLVILSAWMVIITGVIIGLENIWKFLKRIW